MHLATIRQNAWFRTVPILSTIFRHTTVLQETSQFPHFGRRVFSVHSTPELIFPIESIRPHRIAQNARPSRALNRHMRTESQDHASRENGAKSHGATTPEGKLASSRNALKHGMLSDTIVLECESQDRFLELCADLFEEFQPETPRVEGTERSLPDSVHPLER